MDRLDARRTKDMILYVADRIIENKPLLTEIDSRTGDGDHGIGMATGFGKVREKLSAADVSTVNDVFGITGTTMINTMGGASGVIFGLMFSGGIKEMEPLEYLDGASLGRIFEGSLHSIKKRGGAGPGDKTMVDAFEPAVEALKEPAGSGESFTESLKRAEAAAKEGMEKTKEYIARFGKAKTLMERAIGFQDAGATSVWLILRSMREWAEKNG